MSAVAGAVSSFLPSRWAFEGLLLLQERQPVPNSDNPATDGDVPDLAEDYFPIASAQRMGLAADVLALLLMLIGLVATAAWLSTGPSLKQPGPSTALESGSATT